MTLEEEKHLCSESAALRAQLAQVQEQLAAALARSQVLEQQRRNPLSFVKPNGPRLNPSILARSGPPTTTAGALRTTHPHRSPRAGASARLQLPLAGSERGLSSPGEANER
jgi:hypothetical protein